MVSAIKAASFEDDGHGVDEAASFSRALWAGSYGLFVEPLLSFEPRAAASALIFVDGQDCTSCKRRTLVKAALICL